LIGTSNNMVKKAGSKIDVLLGMTRICAAISAFVSKNLLLMAAFTVVRIGGECPKDSGNSAPLSAS
jgi:hypothetical protein